MLLPALLAGLLAACGGTTRAVHSTTSVAGVDPPAKRCGPPARSAEVVTLRTSDDVRLDGAIVGKGPRGIVLVHEAGARVLCGWWPYAVRLADAGFRVLLFDLRCYGLSGCPSGREDDVVDDVAAAVEELRGRGATSIELVGASYGGSVALVATARLADVSALADLSGDELTEPIGGQGRPTTAVQAAAEARAPALLAVARNDGYIALEDERALYRRLGSSRKRLVVLPAEAGHGWDLLARVGAPDEWSQFERTLTAFLVAHSS
jgi:pimeloyl-ACP methyl ester carboxylesterase